MLLKLPCFFLFLEGLFIWLNFQQPGAHPFFLYWFVLLIGLTVMILFLPAPILYHRSREWWAYSNVGWRKCQSPHCTNTIAVPVTASRLIPR